MIAPGTLCVIVGADSDFAGFLDLRGRIVEVNGPCFAGLSDSGEPGFFWPVTPIVVNPYCQINAIRNRNLRPISDPESCTTRDADIYAPEKIHAR